MTSTFLITSSEEFQSAARAELKRFEPQLTEGDNLAPGLFLVHSALTEDDFAALVEASHPIYTRHIFPVQTQIKLEANIQDLENISLVIAEKVQAAGWSPNIQYSVQARLAGEGSHPYSPFAIREAIVSKLAELGQGQENIKDSEQIVSVVCNEGQAYLGLSRPAQNLSGWAGGMRHYAKGPEQISRAEFKLLEALEVFDVDLPRRGTALDLGAAPGGWSRILLDVGLSVIAVDPAALDERLPATDLQSQSRKRTTSISAQPFHHAGIATLGHYRGYAEDYLQQAREEHRRFELICNDMRMDALVAARLMVDFAPLLAPSGFALSSLKLPHETRKLKPTALVNRALAILGEAYGEVQARQLFHNRQEITVLLRQPLA